MANTFTVNGKEYKAKELTYNALCRLEDFGVSMSDVQAKAFSFIRGYIAYCGDIEPEEAGKEIEAHVVKTGNLDAVSNAIEKAVENSGFFQAFQKQETETTKTK
jgi:hypothetical protein|nr:MAG TPA: tail assembly chaperone protein [Caudoviricetes sp.]